MDVVASSRVSSQLLKGVRCPDALSITHPAFFSLASGQQHPHLVVLFLAGKCLPESLWYIASKDTKLVSAPFVGLTAECGIRARNNTGPQAQG